MGRATLTRLAFSDLPGWAGDDHASALAHFRDYCPGLAGRKAGRFADSGAWRRICKALSAHRGPPQAFFEDYFEVWAVDAGGGQAGLFTGYYEPELHGSRSAHGPYQTPLYKRPDDLAEGEPDAAWLAAEWDQDLPVRHPAGRLEDGRLKPYYSRAEIEQGALAGRHLELLWIDDPVDAFFLHIQGAGRVILEDGGIVRVGYDGQNGQPYRAIGRDLVDLGALQPEDLSMQAIRAWLAAHPDDAREMMNRNPSFVFFRETPDLTADQGPVGAAGLPLVAGRSLAVDPRYWCYGLLLWLETTLAGGEGQTYRRLMIAGDTGAAIKGPLRGDIFFGPGAPAAALAGPMKQPGKLYVLLPRDIRLDESRFAVSKRDP